MRLAAVSYGYGVTPEAITGVVVGVFPRACVIACEDGPSVTLVTAETGNLPFGIAVDTSKEFEFDSIEPGAHVSVRGGMLRFAPGDLVIDLRSALPWRNDLGAVGLDLARIASREAWLAAADILIGDGRAVLFISLARARVDALVAATSCFDLEAANAALVALIGLGEGATPAGDDFLVGYCGGLWASAGTESSRRAFAIGLGQRVVAATDRTSRTSRAYLIAAGLGEVSERLAVLVTALTAGSVGATVAAAQAAIAVGHSSGACGVLGLLLGTNVWEAPGSTSAFLGVTVTPEPFPPVPARRAPPFPCLSRFGYSAGM